MASPEQRDEIINRLIEQVVAYDIEGVKATSQEVLKTGVDPYDAVINGLAAGMEKVGELWDQQEYFVPEVLMCSDALYAGLEILQPHVNMKEEDKQARGDVVIGTVEGDVHDIGKNMVRMMFEVAGFTVHDLGRDVPLDKFIEEQLRTGSDLVCLSAMMTTTMLGMEKVIKTIRERNPDVKIMIGGAPVTDAIVERFGADGTADSAPNALKEAIKMVSSLRAIG